MSGITFTVTGSSNDTNLVLSSENAAIHEGDHHDLELHNDINGLQTNVTSLTGRVTNIETKNTMASTSLKIAIKFNVHKTT